MSKQKLTKWFSPEINPARRGVYQTEDDSSPRPQQKGYQYWNGKWWGQVCETTEDAARNGSWKSMFQSNYWRGLARPPKAMP